VLTAEQFNYAGDATAGTVWRLRRQFVYEAVLKRAIDMLLATLGLVATIPIWIAVCAAIRLESPGSPIFVQERVGRRGRRFRFYKFRSMYVDAESRLHEVLVHNETDGPVFKIRQDPRITRVGAFLRRTSLDELPQLFNVLKGDMSLVGPRPPLPREVDQYRPGDLVRLQVKPGLTCLWQVSGRCEICFEEWVRMDLWYVENQGMWTDVRLLARTPLSVLSRRGAY
jgi:exopolysaccharide biosynthesis polyprenyl glycosylphosphotransferase